jgi:hypothetical protein
MTDWHDLNGPATDFQSGSSWLVDNADDIHHRYCDTLGEPSYACECGVPERLRALADRPLWDTDRWIADRLQENYSRPPVGPRHSFWCIGYHEEDGKCLTALPPSNKPSAPTTPKLSTDGNDPSSVQP